MVNDTYAIFESYNIVKESGMSLAGGVGLRASANNTERQTAMPDGVKPPNTYAPGGPTAAQDNQEPAISKEVTKLIQSLTKSAHKADYDSIIIDCMHLSKLASKLANK